jgi:multiple antibiotic resistance protein
MSILSSALLLFLIIDPFGNIPVFVSALKDVPIERRTRIVLRELIIALTVLLFFLFAGRCLLAVMHISEPSLTVAGGILLFLIALRMVFPSPRGTFDEQIAGEPFIVPLAIPFVAGPSAMATVLLIGSGDADRWPAWVAAVVLAWLAAAIMLLLGSKLASFLGQRGLIAMERLMGMLLVAISVEMFLTGVTKFLRAQA